MKLRDAKRHARARMKSQLAALDVPTRRIYSQRITEYVQGLPEWKQSRVVLAFLSMPSEVDTSLMLRSAFEGGKRVGVPRMYGSLIRFHEIDSLDGPWEQHPYGLRQPEANLPQIEPGLLEETEVFVVTPGLCFDAAGWRLGFGRGYYDRFISECRSLPDKQFFFAGVCFHLQLIDQVPCGDMDCQLDALISENGLVFKRSGT